MMFHIEECRGLSEKLNNKCVQLSNLKNMLKEYQRESHSLVRVRANDMMFS